MNDSRPNSSARQITFRSLGIYCLHTAFLVALVCCLGLTALAASEDDLRFRTGVHNSRNRPLSAPQLQTLLASLRQKTGFIELRFDEQGFLTLGNHTVFSGGSAMARELIRAAIEGSKTFELQRHDHSPSIAFAAFEPQRLLKEDRKTWHEFWVIQIDFEDFRQLQGRREVLAAFEPGIVLMHELVHGLLGLKDAIGSLTQLGECDEYINRIRRQLSLPERQHYSAQMWRVPFATREVMAQVSFIRTSDRRKFQLRWTVGSVAGVSAP